MKSSATFLILFLALNQLMCGQSQYIYESTQLKIKKLAEHTYQHISYFNSDDFGKVACNGMVVVNNQEAIILDTPVNESAAVELIHWTGEFLDSKIRAIIPTHFHFDCLGTLDLFHDQGIPSYANNRTIELARSSELPVPKNGFDQSLVLNLGESNLLVEYPGPGHTTDNVIGYFSKDQALFGGCLVKQLGAGDGNLEDADVHLWPATIENIQKKYPDALIIVPGHGSSGGQDLLEYTKALFTASEQTAPYPPSPVITDVSFNWPSHIRLASGSDNWPITWADDDKQYTVWGDGGGFGGTNGIGRSSMGVASIEGNWHAFKPTNVWGGYLGLNSHEITGKSYWIVCVDGILYMWVGMFKPHSKPFEKAKIARSTDHGASWTFTDWSFTKEQLVMMPTVCNYGKNYQGARDQYVYSYLIRFQSEEGPDDYEDKVDWLNIQKPGVIDLARVHRDSVMHREAYRFFSGIRNGQPQWTPDIMERRPVFENPQGVGWCINVSYNAGLGRYILTTEHTETHRGNFSIFDAPEPWGPWSTVYYQERWGEGHIPLNTFYWNFSNKWTSEDGKTFSLIFTGRKENDSFNVIRGSFHLESDP